MLEPRMPDGLRLNDCGLTDCVVLNVAATRIGVVEPFGEMLDGEKLQLTLAEAPAQENVIIPL